MAWPGGGGVEHDQVRIGVAARAASPCQDEDVLDARRGGGHVSIAPEDTRRLATRLIPWPRGTRAGLVGGERPGPHVGGPGRRRLGQLDLLVAEVVGAEHVASPVLPSTSTISGATTLRAAARGQRGGDRRLAHAALARHDDDAGSGEERALDPNRQSSSEARVAQASDRSVSRRCVAGSVRPRRRPRVGRSPTRPMRARSTCVEVAGYLDPVLVDFIAAVHRRRRGRGRRAPSCCSSNSPGSSSATRRWTDLARHRIDDADGAGHRVGRAERRTGPAARPSSPRPPTRSAWRRAAGSATSASLVTPRTSSPRPRSTLAERAWTTRSRLDEGFADRRSTSSSTSTAFETERGRDGGDRRAGHRDPRSASCRWLGQLFHTVASPAVAYLLFVLGHGPDRVRALHRRGRRGRGGRRRSASSSAATAWPCCPPGGWAVGLLVLAMFGFARRHPDRGAAVLDRHRLVSFVVGIAVRSTTAPTPVVDHAARCVRRHVVAMLAGMPAMVRTRFSTPTIGREWMIGEEGEAVTAVAPTARSTCAAPCGGPGPTGPRRSPPASRSWWPGSTASCSRSSRPIRTAAPKEHRRD